MKSLEEVQSEYDQFKQMVPNTPLDLKGFAKYMDEASPTPEREVVYKDKWYNKLDRGVDAVFDYTPDKDLMLSPAGLGESIGSGIGSLVDSLAGTSKVEQTLGALGRDTPRMIAEGLATIPIAAVPGVGESADAAMWANRARKVGQVLGYGGAALKGGSSTDSLLGAALGAGQLYAGNKLLLPETLGGLGIGGKVENNVMKFLNKGAADYVPGGAVAPTSGVSRILAPAAGLGTDVAAMSALNEATRQGMLSVGPNAVGPLDEARNPFTEENVAANVGGAAMFLPQMVEGFRGAARIAPKNVEQIRSFLEGRDAVGQTIIPGTETSADAFVPTDKQVDMPLTGTDLTGSSADKYANSDLTDPVVRRAIVNDVSLTTDERASLLKPKLPDGEDPYVVPTDADAPFLPASSAGTANNIIAPSVFGDDRSLALMGITKNFIQSAKMAEADGHADLAAGLREQAVGALQELTSRGGGQGISMEYLSRLKQNIIDRASFSPPANMSELSSFVQNVKDTIDQFNERQIAFEKEKANREQALDVNNRTAVAEHNNWLQQQELNVGKYRHPNARSAEVVDRLWANGKLEPLTPEWVQKETQDAVDAGHSPEVAVRIAAQKATNYMLDRLPAAQIDDIATRQAGPAPLDASSKANTRQAKLDQLDTDFIKALGDIQLSRTPKARTVYVNGEPKTVMKSDLDLLLDRTVELSRNGNYSEAGADKNNITEGTRIDPRSGLPMSPYPTWQKAVIEAVRSFDPQTGNILLRKPTGGFVEAPITRLFEKGSDSRYVWFPAETRLGTSAGGKPLAGRESYLLFKSKNEMQQYAREHNVPESKFKKFGDTWQLKTKESNVSEINIEGMKGEHPVESYDTAGEEDFKQALAERSGGGLSEGEPDAFRIGQMQEPETVKPEFESTAQESAVKNVNDVLEKRKALVQKSLDSLNEPQLWSIAKDEFGFANSRQAQAKREDFRLALQAALDNLDASPSKGLTESGQEFMKKMRFNGTQVDRTGNLTYDFKQAIRSFFQDANPVQGGKGDLPNSTMRIVRIVKKILDPAVVARVKEGYAKSSGGSGSLISDLKVVNPPKPGEFVTDVARSARGFVERDLGRLGYSGTTKDFLVEVATAIAQQMDMKGVDFLRNANDAVGGQAAPYQNNSRQAMVSLNLDASLKDWGGVEGSYVSDRLIRTLAHEISHLDQFIRDGLMPQPDAYSDERRQVVDNMMKLAESLTPTERANILKAFDLAMPATFRVSTYEPGTTLPYGTHSPTEFFAEIQGMTTKILALDTPAGRAAVNEMIDYLPQELREYTKNTGAMIRDVTGVMRNMIANTKNVSVTEADPFILQKGLEAMHASAKSISALRDADVAIATARSFIETLSSGTGIRPPLGMTSSMVFNVAKRLESNMPDAVRNSPAAIRPEVSPTADAAMKEVQDAFSRVAYNKSMKPSKFVEFIYPFSQMMTSMERQGNPLARDVLSTVLQMEPSSSRMYTGMMKDFLKMGRDGTYNFNEEHPLIKAITEDKNGAWRKNGVDKVSAWQQQNKAQTLFVTDDKGVVQLNPDVKDAAKVWDDIRKNMSLKDQERTMNISVAMDKAGQTASEYLIRHLTDSNINLVGAYLMAADKRLMYDQANQLAMQVYNAYSTNDRMTLSRLLQPDKVASLDKLLIGNVTKDAPNGDGLLATFNAVSQKLSSRPGFRSESLPHKWIVKYRDGDNIRYASAPLEAQARQLARRLESEGKKIIGEVVSRDTLRDITDYDNPEAILGKVAETEKFIYNNFVSEMEKAHGPELAQELREGYDPVGASMKQQGMSSLNKFLGERKSVVDQKEYDYIDGLMGYTRRLATSLAMRGTQQEMRAILSDPRARLMPSFKKLVEAHLTEMMQPRSDFHQKASAFISTWFLGGNLASAIVNGTQSATTLVPWLIAGIDPKVQVGGSVAKAWKDTATAMGSALWVTLGKDWQRLATAAKAKGGVGLSLDETLASMYKRRVDDGGIQNAVVDDLMYGHDQNMLRLARFGHGDYGHVPIGEMVKNKIYIGSQLMMSLFKAVEHFNGKTSFLAGVRQGFENGLTGDALYAYAEKMQSLATFGGGRSNAPGIASGGRGLKEGINPLRTGFGLANSMQQYGYGVIGMYGQLGKDMLGGSRMLTPIQRYHATKAFGTMLMTQVAIAGTMGLPFVGATLTLLEKMFGIPATQAVRQGLASMSDDKETGAAIADTALNGFGNQLTGIDISSRTGVSNLLGTSSYKGFNLMDMMGPVPSINGNAVEGLGLFASGKPLQAARDLVPTAFRNAFEMADSQARYGDAGFRDKSGNLQYMPSDGERLGYAFGVRPAVLSERRQMQQMLVNANKRVQSAMDDRYDAAAQSMLRGDIAPAERLAQDMSSSDPTIKPIVHLRAIMDRALAAKNQADMLASGSRFNEAERSGIADTFGKNTNPRQSEMDLQKQRIQMALQLRAPQLIPTDESLTQSMMVDTLVKQKGMPRSQAIRLVQFLNSSPESGI